jgi:hypothetical protein
VHCPRNCLWKRDSEITEIRTRDDRDDYTGHEVRRGADKSFWLFLFLIFLFAAQPKEIFLDGLKKLEQRSHKCVELRGECVNIFFQSRSLLFSL